MNDEKKLYSLMAQAEDLQEHAKYLHNQAVENQKIIDNIQCKTQKIFDDFSENIKNITSKTIQKTLVTSSMTGLVFVLFGVITFFTLTYYTKSLRNDINFLNTKIDILQSNADKMHGLGIKIITYSNNINGIQLPNNIEIDRIGKDTDEKTVILLK